MAERESDLGAEPHIFLAAHTVHAAPPHPLDGAMAHECVCADVVAIGMLPRDREEVGRVCGRAFVEITIGRDLGFARIAELLVTECGAEHGGITRWPETAYYREIERLVAQRQQYVRGMERGIVATDVIEETVLPEE